MCTQHPDSTIKVGVSEEVDEAIVSFTLYGCDEVMVDFEGKLTPYAQPKDIVVKAHETGLEIGAKLFITPRIPNPELEEVDRSMLALEAVMLANYYSWSLAELQAVKWIILPMVEDVKSALFVQRVIEKKARIMKDELKVKVDTMRLVPLIEDAAHQLNIEKMLTTFYSAVAEGGEPEGEDNGIRVFLGISDSAVRHGHVASSIALRIALVKIWSLSERGYKINPIVGSGTPPFRGAMNSPELVELEAKQFRGYHTVTIQSAVRYDAPLSSYLHVKRKLLENLGQKPQPSIANDEDALQVVNEASTSYREVVSRHIDKIARVASLIPVTRERVPWKAYGRALEGKNGRIYRVPRAIVYTASWYTLGLPPLLLDSSFLLKSIKQETFDGVILKLVPGLIDELKFEAQFFHPPTAANNLGERTVKEAIELLDHLGVDPRAEGSYAMLLREAEKEPYILALGKLRGFLG